MNADSSKARATAPTPTCPVGLCPHPLVLHDVDEIPGPRIERCIVPWCGCFGRVERVGVAA